jgi:hypothetical protein
MSAKTRILEAPRRVFILVITLLILMLLAVKDKSRGARDETANAI